MINRQGLDPSCLGSCAAAHHPDQDQCGGGGVVGYKSQQTRAAAQTSGVDRPRIEWNSLGCGAIGQGRPHRSKPPLLRGHPAELDQSRAREKEMALGGCCPAAADPSCGAHLGYPGKGLPLDLCRAIDWTRAAGALWFGITTPRWRTTGLFQEKKIKAPLPPRQCGGPVWGCYVDGASGRQ